MYSVNSLQRKLARLQNQAKRRALANRPVEITTCWGNEDRGPREPGVTYIITDWHSAAPLARDEKDE